MHDALKFMKENVEDNDPHKFTNVEYEKFRRVVDYMNITEYPEEQIIQGRKDFYNWFNALDERRDTKFLDVFPEMTAFYKMCEEVNDSSE